MKNDGHLLCVTVSAADLSEGYNARLSWILAHREPMACEEVFTEPDKKKSPWDGLENLDRLFRVVRGTAQNYQLFSPQSVLIDLGAPETITRANLFLLQVAHEANQTFEGKLTPAAEVALNFVEEVTGEINKKVQENKASQSEIVARNMIEERIYGIRNRNWEILTKLQKEGVTFDEVPDPRTVVDSFENHEALLSLYHQVDRLAQNIARDVSIADKRLRIPLSYQEVVLPLTSHQRYNRGLGMIVLLRLLKFQFDHRIPTQWRQYFSTFFENLFEWEVQFLESFQPPYHRTSERRQREALLFLKKLQELRRRKMTECN